MQNQRNRVFTRLEILKMARDVVNNEYIDLRGRMHNQWMVDSEALWLTKRQKLEYPTFPPFPTEEEIVRRAKILASFLEEGDTERNYSTKLRSNDVKLVVDDDKDNKDDRGTSSVAEVILKKKDSNFENTSSSQTVETADTEESTTKNSVENSSQRKQTFIERYLRGT